MEGIIGRKNEIEILDKLSKSPEPEFVVVSGRRRVGKTYLIKKYYNNDFAFYMTGTANVSTAEQLANFRTLYNMYTEKQLDNTPKTWFEAFNALRTLLEKSKNKIKVVFLDELPWMDTPRSNFTQALEFFWNSFGSTHKGLKLITCGSAASWLLNKLINDKGGLHNRVTRRISLLPFTLKETEAFLYAKQVKLERQQILQIYSVMGGIPFYLDAIEKGMSSAQIIDMTCFDHHGLLRNEYNILYKSLFARPENYMDVVNALSTKAQGLTRDEIVALSKIANGGTLTKVLNELEVSGFIQKYHPFLNKTKNSLYRLTDPYSLFYHKFIKDSKTDGKNTWVNMLNTPAYNTWRGYAFEYVCMSHINQIKHALGISGVYSENASWRSNDKEFKAQIDLLIDRKDGIITVCEMKFSDGQFEITKDYATKLRNKLYIFKNVTKTRKTILPAMISTFGVKQNQYSLDLVQNDIKMDSLFEF